MQIQCLVVFMQFGFGFVFLILRHVEKLGSVVVFMTHVGPCVFLPYFFLSFLIYLYYETKYLFLLT